MADPQTQAQTHAQTHALSDVLDRLESSADGDSVSVQTVVDRLGTHSFAALILAFSLVAVSPASAIPGLTTGVALIVFILVAQMIIGRKGVWLPEFLLRREVSSQKLRTAISWLRKPVEMVERFLRPRLTFLLHRPWFFLPQILILGLTLFMPVMEFIPTSGSIASATIALFAAGLLTRDGGLVLAAMLLLLAIPVAVWQIGFTA